jgi:hypothetical protein
MDGGGSGDEREIGGDQAGEVVGRGELRNCLRGGRVRERLGNEGEQLVGRAMVETGGSVQLAHSLDVSGRESEEQGRWLPSLRA